MANFLGGYMSFIALDCYKCFVFNLETPNLLDNCEGIFHCHYSEIIRFIVFYIFKECLTTPNQFVLNWTDLKARVYLIF